MNQEQFPAALGGFRGPSEAEVDDACMWFRHDFGLLSPEDAASVRFEAREWLRAWGKTRYFAPLDLSGLPAETLASLVRDLVDDDPCEFDHHGYCQTHAWMRTDPECPHARARRLGLVAPPAGTEPDGADRWWHAAVLRSPFTPGGTGDNDGRVRDRRGEMVADCAGHEARAVVIAALLNRSARARGDAVRAPGPLPTAGDDPSPAAVRRTDPLV